MILSLKHLAFAVTDADTSLSAYQRLLDVGWDAQVKDYPKSRTRTALFRVGGVEFQLCQSLDADGRFAEWIDQRRGEGLHHICFEVDELDTALATAIASGATLKECRACRVIGKHVHPEGYIAFLQDQASGIEIEFMQVYKPGEGPQNNLGV